MENKSISGLRVEFDLYFTFLKKESISSIVIVFYLLLNNNQKVSLKSDRNRRY